MGWSRKQRDFLRDFYALCERHRLILHSCGCCLELTDKYNGAKSFEESFAKMKLYWTEGEEP